MFKLKLILKTSRPLTSIVAGLAMFVILLKDIQSPVWLDILQSIPIILATMVGFILNDIYDYKKDAMGNLQRPIALDQLNRKEAFIAAVFISGLAVALEGIANQFASLNILIVTLIGVLLYSPLSKNMPTIKGVATAGLTLTPIVYASMVLGRAVPSFIYLATAVFIIGRELLLDAKDFELDMKSGIKTIVAYLGYSFSRTTAWLLMFSGMIYYVLNIADPRGFMLALLGILVLIVAAITDYEKNVSNGGITILTLVLCILAIPFAL